MTMTIGTVKFFNASKGFGFISPEGGGKDVFVHVSAVEAAGMRNLNEGQKVNFDIQPDARGSRAANLSAACLTAGAVSLRTASVRLFRLRPPFFEGEPPFPNPNPR